MEYLIPLGEKLDTEKKVIEAVLLFEKYIQKKEKSLNDLWNQRPILDFRAMLREWAEPQWWFEECPEDANVVWKVFCDYAFGNEQAWEKIQSVDLPPKVVPTFKLVFGQSACLVFFL